MKYILGIDTSCYTTSLGVVDLQGGIVQDERKILDVEQGGRGLRQSEAVFQHIKNFPTLFERLDPRVVEHIVAVAVSSAPRKQEDSYMPVFKAGEAFARSIAKAKGVPLLQADHQTGHIYAGIFTSHMLENKAFEELISQPMLAVHLSGGTLEILLFHENEYRIIASTGDISAGQFIDRVGVALGASFPAGPTMERWAIAYEGEEIIIPSSVKGTKCSFSGAETKALSFVGQYPKEKIAHSVFNCVIRTLEKLIMNACIETGCQRVLLAGGVISSRFIRQGLSQRLAKHARHPEIHYCEGKYSADNGVGIALWGAQQFKADEEE